jgi:hypothetical protein
MLWPPDASVVTLWAGRSCSMNTRSTKSFRRHSVVAEHLGERAERSDKRGRAHENGIGVSRALPRSRRPDSNRGPLHYAPRQTAQIDARAAGPVKTLTGRR